MSSKSASPPPSKAYWFRAKRYGWGWGLPLCWQGWVVLAVFAAVLIAAGGLLRNPSQPWPFLGVVWADCLALVAVCWLKGEPPKWRWGGRG